MSDQNNQAMLEEMRALRMQAEKDSMLMQQMLRQNAKYPPHERTSPKPPSVVAQERQSETIPSTTSRAIDAAKEIQEKVTAPMFQKTFGKMLSSQDSKQDQDKQNPSLLAGIKQTLTPAMNVLSKQNKYSDEKLKPAAEKERRVVNKAQEVTITEISPKAKKGFGSIFSGLFKSNQDKKTIPGKQSTEQSSGGFLSSLMGMLLGGMGVSGIGSMFTGMVIGPMLTALGRGLLSVVSAPFRLVGTGISKAVEGIAWAGKAIAGSKIGQSISGLFTTMGNKISTGMEVVKKSRVGQAVGRLFSGISTKIGNVGTSIMTGLQKIPGVSRLTSALSTGLGGVASGIGKVASKALRIAGPVGAVISTGISAFEGATAAIDEYKQSGSLASAAREGLASFTESFTFGLLDKETVSSGLSKAGQAITDVTDTVVGSVKSLWGKAKGFLFGSPHASTYVDAASAKIHDGTVQLADASLKVANASKTFSQANKNNQQSLIDSANTLDRTTVDVSKASTVNQQLSEDAIARVNRSSQALAKIDSAGVADSAKILKQTEQGTKSLGERVKEAFAKFSPLSIIANAATATIDSYKDAITRISTGEDVLTVLGDTLLKNAKTALSAIGNLVMSPFNFLKDMLSNEDKLQNQATEKTNTRQRATVEQMSKLTQVNRDMIAKAGRAPEIQVNVIDNKPRSPEGPTIKSTDKQSKLSQTSTTQTPPPPAPIRLINDVNVNATKSRLEQIKPVIVDKTETKSRLDELRTQQQQTNMIKNNVVESKIEDHLSKLVSLQEAQLQQAVTTNQNTGRMTESIQNIKPSQNNTNIINQSATKLVSNSSPGLDNYRHAAREYNSVVL